MSALDAPSKCHTHGVNDRAASPATRPVPVPVPVPVPTARNSFPSKSITTRVSPDSAFSATYLLRHACSSKPNPEVSVAFVLDPAVRATGAHSL